jgi:DNA invertase Pin-like site-specific DNA recombinase
VPDPLNRSEAARRGLEAARAAGIHIGRPAGALDPDVAARLLALRAAPLGYRRIAAELNRAGMTTPSGAAWGTSSVSTGSTASPPETRRVCAS